VNRIWQSLFGQGLVVTPEDFGSQGQLPSHPELLDWLAHSFIDSGWNVKQLVKTIVMSSTYRQDSACSDELWAKDPGNVLLGRGPRYRLPAEMLRDNALMVSGLLVNKLGGPAVKPYQPEGLWKEKSGKVYKRDQGEGSHRRSLYTYWKRTSPPPAMMTLDAAKRDVCQVKRQVTATPLQALVLLNDPQYVEAARALAERVLLELPGADVDARLANLFKRLTSRAPEPNELSVLRELLEEQRSYFEQEPDNATQFLAIGDHVPNASLDVVNLAAWSIVAEALLNFDETVTLR
jgi:hypothetical protein